MALPFRVVRSDLGFRGEFAQPAFNMFRDSPSLYKRIYTRLERHGVRLADFRAERGDGTVGDAHVSCSLTNLKSSVRIRMEAIELNCFDMLHVETQALNDAGVGLIESVAEHIPDAPFKTYTVAMAFHGTIDGTLTKDFLAPFIGKSPGGLGQSVGSGSVFYYGAEEERLLTALTLDLSGFVNGGLFLRTHTIWNAERVLPKELPDKSGKHIAATVSAAGLAIVPTQP